MNALHKLLNPKITMMTSDSANSINGCVVFNGQEWAIKPFKIKAGATPREKELALINQAVKEHGDE